MCSELIIAAENVSKKFDSIPVFENISFCAGKGTVVGVKGRNGAGKSTLLNIIAGLETVSAGELTISLNGKKIEHDGKNRIIGMVSPLFFFYEELTVFENLTFISRLRGCRLSETELTKVIASVDLLHKKDVVVSKLSSGMKQRLKLAQSRLHKPPILLLDEPGTNLDGDGIAIVDTIIEDHRSAGIVVIASNEQNELMCADTYVNLP